MHKKKFKISSSFVFQAYELSTLTGTQVMLLVASETGHVYTFATRYCSIRIMLLKGFEDSCTGIYSISES